MPLPSYIWLPSILVAALTTIRIVSKYVILLVGLLRTTPQAAQSDLPRIFCAFAWAMRGSKPARAEPNTHRLGQEGYKEVASSPGDDA